MPIFVYEREDGTVFEEILKYKDRDITVCPTTGQQCTRVEFPGANFHLKGGGWEKDGYRPRPKAKRTIESHIDEHRSDLKEQQEHYKSKC